MSKEIRLLVALAVAVPMVPAIGQERSTINTAALKAAAAKPAAVTNEGLRAFLATERVRQIAAQSGIDTKVLSEKVARLDQNSLQQISQRTQMNDQLLAGGRDVYVISATTVIIILLLLILLTD